MFKADDAIVFNLPKSVFVAYWPGAKVVTIAGKGVVDDYAVKSIPTAWPGCSYILQKDDNQTIYNVFVAANGQDDFCDCKGFEHHGHCKHHGAVRELLYRGDLEDLDRPGENFPSPEQLAAQAGVEDPFKGW
jgi:hypothetical protein